MSPKKRGQYRAFMLRCWKRGFEENAEATTWWFSIEEVRGGQQRHEYKFSDLEMVFEYLKASLDESDAPKE